MDQCVNGFWSQLFNANTVDAWISVIGTFFGTLLAGVISALIAIWTLKSQNQSEELQRQQNKTKAIQIIEQFVELAIGSLILIEPGPSGEPIYKNEIRVDLLKLKAINYELSNIPSDFIALDMNSHFQNMRVLLKILEIEIDSVLSHNEEQIEANPKELSKVDILGRTTMIVKELKKFSNKDYLEGLHDALVQECLAKKSEKNSEV